MLRSETIKSYAIDAGFDLCGVVPVKELTMPRERFEGWLAQGFGGSMEYLGRNVPMRFDPSLLVPSAQSVIVCAVNCKNRFSLQTSSTDATPLIATHAYAADYHNTIRSMLRVLSARLTDTFGPFACRVAVDSAPVAEKSWAVEAGLGWIGRHSMLVTRRFGSFVLLGELIVDAPVDCYDVPYNGVGCGSCRRCVDACPAAAIMPDRSVDARRCIAALTIEKHGPNNAPAHDDLHGWLFGCGVCQAACPYGIAAPEHGSKAFDPLFDPSELCREELERMSDEEFARRFSATPLGRYGLQHLKENLPTEQV